MEIASIMMKHSKFDCRSSLNNDRSMNTPTESIRRLLVILTTTLIIASLSSTGVVDSAAILPPHVLLKSETTNKVEESRSACGGSTHHEIRTRPFGPSSWRPTPSEVLPIRPLLQSKDSFPSKSDRDQKALGAQLGKDFDPSFLSIKRPTTSVLSPNGTYDYDKSAIKSLASSIRLPGLSIPSRRSKVEIRSLKKRQMFQSYLAAYTYCPVHYKWIDLGPRFWPRWIRQGDCSGKEKGARSCSFPPGMYCKPQKSTSKTVLWWHCQSQGQCQWIAIKYPVITTCKCSCSS